MTLTAPFLLSACDPRPVSERDPKSILDLFSKMEGPEVKGVGDALLQSAQQAEKARQYGRAVQFYQQLVDKEPDNMEYLASLADCYRRAGDADGALNRYNKILDTEPQNLDALEGKGLALLSKGDFDAASTQFQAVMAANGTRWRTLNAVAILFVIKDMPKEALAYYEEALKQKPDEPAILNNVGLTLALTQDFTRAIQALTSASERLDSGSEERKRADLNLALVYGLSGDMESAEDVASKHLKDSALNNNLGFYAYLADNKELAKAYLNNALSGSSVFYEKAWKNLEIVGGSRNSGQSRYSTRNRYSQDDAPFSSIKEDEMYIPSQPVAAPVSNVGTSGDLEDLTPPKLPEKVNSGAMNNVAPATNVTMAPTNMSSIDNGDVKVFPAVPARPILDEGNVKPVSMSVTSSPNVQTNIRANAPANMQTNVQTNVQTNRLAGGQLDVGDRITVPSMEDMAPRFSPETSSRVMPETLPQANYTTNIIATPEAPPLMEDQDTSKPLRRIRNPAGDIIVFQKPKAAAKKKKPAGGQEVVYQKKAEPKPVEEVSAPADAPVAEESREVAKAPVRRAVNPDLIPDAEPADEPMLKAPVEQDPNEVTQPVQQKSTIDYFKQIF